MTRRQGPAVVRTVVLAVVLGIVGAACAADRADDAGSAADGGTHRPSAPAPEGDAAESGGSDEAGEGSVGSGVEGGQSVLLATLDGRSVIRTAEMTIRTDTVLDAGRRAGELVTRAGGYLESGQTWASDGDADDPAGTRSSSTLVFRVPPGEFDGLLRRFADLGTLVDENVDIDDVTERVVDLRSRRLALEASVARLRDLIGEAGGITDVVTLERELVRREADLESLRGQLRALEDRVDLATVTLRIEPTPVEAAAVDDALPDPVTALGAGIDVFVTIVVVLVAMLAFSAPFLATAAILAGIVLLGVRYRRRRLAAG